MNRVLALAWLSSLPHVSSLWTAPSRWVPSEQPNLRQEIDSAPLLNPQEVCVPVKSIKVGETMLVPNPDGKTYDVLQWYYREYSQSTTVFIVDLATGEMKRDGIPDGRQIHICGRVLGPNGLFYITTPDRQRDMELWIYDPTTNTLTYRGVIAPGLGGENRPMVIGTDGKIYGAGSRPDDSRVGAYQIDPDTGKVTDYGGLGPSHKPAGCWCQSLGADDEWIYLASGKVPWYLVAFNRKTREERVLLETDRVLGNITVSQRPDGCTARATALLGSKNPTDEFWLYQGKAIPKTDNTPPWPARSMTPRPLPPRPELYTERLDPDPDGWAELWYRLPEAKEAAAKNPPMDASPEALGWKVVRFRVDLFPMPIRRLTELPDGRLFGTADFYLGNFVFDPATGQWQHLGKCHLSHYSTTFADGKIYMSGYPSSPVYVLDLKMPWTLGHGTLGKPAPPETDRASNPRLLTRLAEFTRTHKMYGAATGADGKVYFGGQCIRNANGGGLGWWDPKTEQAGGIWEPFTAYAIHYLASAEEGKYLVLSTRAVRDDTRNNWTPDQGKLFVYDVLKGQIVREIEPVLGAKSTGPVVEVMPGRVLGAAADPKQEGAGILYGVDIHTGEVLFRKGVPYAVPEDVTYGRTDFRKGPDGHVWTYLGKALVRIDPTTVTVEVLGKVNQPGVLAFAGNNVYLGGTESLRRLPGLLK